MLKLMPLFLLLSFVTMNSSASVLTLESMLRHGSNVDLDGKLVNGKFTVSKVSEQRLEADQVQSTIFNNFAIQWVGHKDSEKPDQLMLLKYKASRFSSAELANMVSARLSSFQSKIMPGVYEGLYLSVISSLLRNDGSTFIKYLKSIGIDVSMNKELLNVEKQKLLNSYKEYLKQNKENEGEIALENPLSPKDPEEAKKVKELLKESFYMPTPGFKLVKRGTSFSWIFERDTVFMEFNFEHQLKKVEIKTELGSYGVYCGPYQSYPGDVVFPEYIMFKLENGTTYKISTKKITAYPAGEDSFQNKLNFFRKKFAKVNKSKASQVVEFLNL